MSVLGKFHPGKFHYRLILVRLLLVDHLKRGNVHSKVQKETVGFLFVDKDHDPNPDH